VCWERRPVGKLWLSGLVDIQDAVRYRLIFVLIASVVATDLCTSHIFLMVKKNLQDGDKISTEDNPSFFQFE